MTEPLPAARVVPPEATIKIGHGGPLAVADDAVFVVGGGQVSRVNPVSNTVEQTIETPEGATAVAIGIGSIWIAFYDHDRLVRYDLVTGDQVAEWDVAQPAGVAVAADAAWVANHHDGGVTRIDPATNEIVATVDVGPEGLSGPNEMTAVGDELWVGVPNLPGVVLIDAASNTVEKSLTIYWPAWPCGPPSVIDGEVWISSCSDGPVVAVADIEAGRHRGSVDVGGVAGAPIAAGGLVWFSVMEQEGDPAELVGIDPTTLEVVDAIELGVPAYQPVVAFDSVWFEHDGVLTRIPAESLEGS